VSQVLNLNLKSTEAVIRELPLGLKPGLILKSLRGLEAPLFHVTVRIIAFFPQPPKPCPFKTIDQIDSNPS
jgi:hypothetical protein